MILSPKFKTIIFVIFFILLFPIPKAYAYLDPGAGGMLLQIVAGGVVGILTILKLYWKNITQWFKKPVKKQK